MICVYRYSDPMKIFDSCINIVGSNVMETDKCIDYYNKIDLTSATKSKLLNAKFIMIKKYELFLRNKNNATKWQNH